MSVPIVPSAADYTRVSSWLFNGAAAPAPELDIGASAPVGISALLSSVALASVSAVDAWRDFKKASGGETASSAARGGLQAIAETGNSEAAVFNRLVELKVQTSQVAMHLESGWRAGLFRQLDALVDAENWDFSDELPTLDSYMTFLRLLILLGKPRRPGLGCVQPGNILATWTVDQNRLTIECQPNDKLKWIVTRYLDGGKVSVAAHSTVTQLPELLAPYKPDIWFNAYGVR